MFEKGLEIWDKSFNSKHPSTNLSAYIGILYARKDFVSGKQAFSYRAIAGTLQRCKAPKLFNGVLVTEVRITTRDCVPDLIHLGQIAFNLLEE
jgi:hypothetical protein